MRHCRAVFTERWPLSSQGGLIHEPIGRAGGSAVCDESFEVCVIGTGEHEAALLADFGDGAVYALQIYRLYRMSPSASNWSHRHLRTVITKT
jgi:hypothetical protein